MHSKHIFKNAIQSEKSEWYNNGRTKELADNLINRKKAGASVNHYINLVKTHIKNKTEIKYNFKNPIEIGEQITTL